MSTDGKSTRRDAKERPTIAARIVVDHEAGRLVRAWRSDDGEELARWSDPLLQPEADLRTLVSQVAKFEPPVWIGWRDVRDASEDLGPPGWSVPRHEGLCFHAGLTDAERARVASLGFIEQVEGLFTPNETRRCDWLLCAEAGWIHASQLRRLGWWQSAPNWSVALIDFGRRASRNGVLCLVAPALRDGALESGGPFGPRSIPLACFVQRGYGQKWLLFWAAIGTWFGPRRVSLWIEVLRALFVDRDPPLVDGSTKIRENGQRQEGQRQEGQGQDGQRQEGQSESNQLSDHREHSPVAVETSSPGGGSGATVSVVLPTLGRPRSVAALLRDLAAQTLAVHEVIVVEQGVAAAPSGPGLVRSDLPADVPTGLPYELQWFQVSWAGACRARNLAMSRAKGEWLLLLDDDVRCPPAFSDTLFNEMERWGLDAASARVWTPTGPIEEDEKFGDAFPASRLRDDGPSNSDWMWPGFAGGASMVRADLAREVDGFDERLDLGYGEDFEFGLRLREAGARFLHLQRPYVVHYHEPVGGFRAPTQQPWHREEEPKPSPYILQSRAALHRNCRRGYAMMYLIGALRAVWWPWRAPGVLRRWRASRRWARRLGQNAFGGIESWQKGPAPAVVDADPEVGGGDA